MSAHTSETQLRLIGKLLLEGELHCEAGLHVGAGKGSLEIGSSDNPVIKDAFGRPYIPAVRCAGGSVRCSSKARAWRFPPNWFICRGDVGRRCASTRATVPTTKSASCSDAIQGAWKG